MIRWNGLIGLMEISFDFVGIDRDWRLRIGESRDRRREVRGWTTPLEERPFTARRVIFVDCFRRLYDSPRAFPGRGELDHLSANATAWANSNHRLHLVAQPSGEVRP
jgi:hypothetical protein